MNKKLILLIVALLCFSALQPITLTAASFYFQKNLKLGDSSQDVYQLQIVLNNDVDTQVSTSGVGSKGQETSYFGQLTFNAVKRFQAKYRKELLDPYNISMPTGFVGVATRAKLNKIIDNPTKILAPVPVVSTSTRPTSTNIAPTLGNIPRLYTTQPWQIKKGDSLSLVGFGFNTTNTIYIGNNVFTGVVSQDGNNLSFILPTTSTIQNGDYEIWVENKNGTSKVANQPIIITITDNPLPGPMVLAVSPLMTSGLETVTVTGTGFTSNGNDVVSGFGQLKNLSSNGTQITFSPRDLIPMSLTEGISAGVIINIDFIIINENGSSNQPSSVKLKL